MLGFGLLTLFWERYEATEAYLDPLPRGNVVIDHYNRWVADSPYPELAHWILPGAVLVSVAASVMGCALLLISLVKTLWRRQPSKA
jgi:hypothetical protein